MADGMDQYNLLPLERNGFVYRFANIYDFEKVKYVVDEVFQFHLSEENYVQYCNDPNHTILLAQKEDQAVGTLCMERQCDYFNDRHTIVFVKNAGIREEYRRNGVFKQLYAIAYEYAALTKAAAIELTCADYRTAAHCFYLNNGFTKKKTTVFIREIEET